MSVQVRMLSSGLEQTIKRHRGRFVAGGQAAIVRGHVQMARMVQDEMVAVLEEEIDATGREQRGTKFLQQALQSDDNFRLISAVGFDVGLDEHMNASPAGAYWRNLEEGTDVFVGRELMFFPERAVTPFRDPKYIGFGVRRGLTATVEQAIRPYRYMARGADRAAIKLVANNFALAKQIYQNAGVIMPASSGFAQHWIA